MKEIIFQKIADQTYFILDEHMASSLPKVFVAKYTASRNPQFHAKVFVFLTYARMNEEEFKQCYTALINAAVRTIFKGCGKSIEDKLISFF